MLDTQSLGGSQFDPWRPDDQITRAFLDAMASAGVHMDIASAGGKHPIADGKVHRADSLDPKGKGRKHIWYVLHADHPASGAFGHHKRGIQDTWTVAGDVKKLTKEERRTLAARIEQNKREHAEMMARMHAEAAAAAALIMAATEKASNEHAYLAKKGLPVFPGLRQLSKTVRYTVDGEEKTARAGVLVVPMFKPAGDATGKPELVGAQLINGDGRKLFVKGTAKAGSYCSIGKPAEGEDIYIAEGYATGARVHQAMGKLVFVAFDSGNLEPVAKTIRARYPQARLIFAADNDRFTTQPINNPGLTKAREAAEAVGGMVVFPSFRDEEVDATDFDDLAQIRGLDAVRSTINDTLNPPAIHNDPPPYDEPPAYMDSMPDHGEAAPARDPVESFNPVADLLETFGHPHFRCLGVDGTTMYYQPCKVAQVIALPAAAHKIENLCALAPLQWWETEFPAKKEGVDMKAAVNACIRACQQVGKFSLDRAMGRGVYIESDGSVIAHLGDRLIVDGQERDFFFRSNDRRIWEYREPIPVGNLSALDHDAASVLRDMCGRLDWQESASAPLLAGFIVVAPLCGALRWRPHLWVSGALESGKSFVLNNFMMPLLGGTGIKADGGSTEAGLRQQLGTDALPVVFDEAEPKDQMAAARVAAILELVRPASSEGGAVVRKGTPGGREQIFRIRSCFAFASIDIGIKQSADESRIVKLRLRSLPESASAEDRIQRERRRSAFRRDLDRMLEERFGERLFLRSLALVKTINHNAAMLADAIAEREASRRLGDVFGTLLAGWHSLRSDERLSVDAARVLIESFEKRYGRLIRNKAERDCDLAFSHLLQSTIDLDHGRKRSVGELIALVIGGEDGTEEIHRALSRHGLRVERQDEPGAGNALLVCPKHQKLSEIFRATQWATSPWDTLAQLDGASVTENARRFNGGRGRAVRIELDDIAGDL